MRIAEVIGTVTLSRVPPERWSAPAGSSACRSACKALRRRRAPDGEDLVIYDDLGAGLRQPDRLQRRRRGGGPVPSGEEAGGCVLCVHPGSIGVTDADVQGP